MQRHSAALRAFIFASLAGATVPLLGCAPAPRGAVASGETASAAAASFESGEVVIAGDFDAEAPRYSPNGRDIAFTIERGGRQDVAVMPASGGSPSLITSGGRNMHPAWSPDGTRLVFISVRAGEADLYTIPLRGSGASRITHSGVDKSAPDWSPDNRTIVYSSNAGGNWNIWSVPAPGGTPRRLTDHRGDEWNPRYSPDGRFILFSTNWGENANIDAWMIPAGGGEPIRLTSGLDDDVTPAWSPDGRRIAFYTDLGGLFVMDLASGKRTSIAPGEGFQDILSWSPDGRSILASRNPEFFRLFEVDVERGGSRPLGLQAWNVWTPDLSRRTGAIAFARMDEAGNGDVWTLPRRGVHPRRLTTDTAPDLSPAWSPDGKRIAFVSRREGPGDIWVMPATGQVAKRWTTLRSAYRPRWCNGHSIVFQSERAADGQQHIWMISADGQLRQLTHGRREVDPDCVLATGDLLYSASFGEGAELFRLPVGSGKPIQLTRDGALARFPRASPDGTSVAYISNRRAGREIFVMPITGGVARQLTNDGGEKSPPAWTPDGKSIVYSIQQGRSQIRRYSASPVKP